MTARQVGSTSTFVMVCPAPEIAWESGQCGEGLAAIDRVRVPHRDILHTEKIAHFLNNHPRTCTDQGA